MKPIPFSEACLPDCATQSEIAEIRQRCESGEAICLETADGFLVVALKLQDDALELFILAALAGRFGAVARQLPRLEALAKDWGAATMAFESRRKGWARRLGTQWHPRGTNELVKVL